MLAGLAGTTGVAGATGLIRVGDPGQVFEQCGQDRPVG